MDINRLEEFAILAQHGSFRTAAGELGISPALLSSHISALETKAGVRLVERSAHRFELTEPGRRFLAEARDMVNEYRQTLQSIGTDSSSEHLGLKIGMTGFIIPSKLGPYMDIINLRYPNIKLEILDDRSKGISEGLADGTYDVFFSYCPDDRQYEGVEKEFVYSTRVQVLVPLNHHLAGKSAISSRELDGERFVLYPETAESAMRDVERGLLDRSGINYSVYEGKVCPSAYYIMVPVGKGLVLCPWVMRNMVPPNTAALSVTDPEFVISMHMFYRRDCPNPFLGEFLDGFRSFENRRDD